MDLETQTPIDISLGRKFQLGWNAYYRVWRSCRGTAISVQERIAGVSKNGRMNYNYVSHWIECGHAMNLRQWLAKSILLLNADMFVHVRPFKSSPFAICCRLKIFHSFVAPRRILHSAVTNVFIGIYKSVLVRDVPPMNGAKMPAPLKQTWSLSIWENSPILIDASLAHMAQFPARLSWCVAKSTN